MSIKQLEHRNYKGIEFTYRIHVFADEAHYYNEVFYPMPENTFDRVLQVELNAETCMSLDHMFNALQEKVPHSEPLPVKSVWFDVSCELDDTVSWSKAVTSSQLIMNTEGFLHLILLSADNDFITFPLCSIKDIHITFDNAVND